MREAFSYFSVLPVGVAGAPRAAALAWLPLVGAVTGGVAGGIAQLAQHRFGHPVAVALAFGLSIALTGAIHVDGLLDAADALGASVPFAVVTLAVASAFWLAALAALDPARLALGVAAAAAAARWSVVWLAFGEPYGTAGATAQAGTLAGARAARPPWAVMTLMTLLVFGLAYAVRPPWTAAAPLAGLLVLFGAPFARRGLGGRLNGDLYGAGIVIAEILVLLALGALPSAR